MATGGYDPESLRQRQELNRAVAEQRELSPDELFALYAVHDVIELDHFQRSRSPQELARQPLSTKFREAYPDSYKTLSNNTALYDDELEGEIFRDSLIQNILLERGSDPRNLPLTTALRTRRSIVVYLLKAYQEISSPESDQDAG